MLPRFFAPHALGTGSVIALPEDEATHLTRVLRLGRGDAVRVFDGLGHEWRGDVETASRAAVTVRLVEAVAPAPEAGITLALALAILKGDKMDDVVRDAVMAGVRTITPIVTERTELSLTAITRSRRVERWRRIALASLKQCGRAVLPEIGDAVTFEHWNAQVAAVPRAVLVEPGHAAPDGLRSLYDLPRSPGIELAIGPEGGWTPRELAAARESGSMLVTLRGATLRADASPLVVVSALRALWKDF